MDDGILHVSNRSTVYKNMHAQSTYPVQNKVKEILKKHNIYWRWSCIFDIDFLTTPHLFCASSSHWACWQPGRPGSVWAGWWVCPRASSTGSGSIRFSACRLSSSSPGSAFPAQTRPEPKLYNDPRLLRNLFLWQQTFICLSTSGCRKPQSRYNYVPPPTPPHPVFFGKSLHFLVEQKVNSQGVAGTVGQHGAQNLTVLVAHFLRHVQQHRVVNFLDVYPETRFLLETGCRRSKDFF